MTKSCIVVSVVSPKLTKGSLETCLPCTSRKHLEIYNIGLSHTLNRSKVGNKLLLHCKLSSSLYDREVKRRFIWDLLSATLDTGLRMGSVTATYSLVNLYPCEAKIPFACNNFYATLALTQSSGLPRSVFPFWIWRAVPCEDSILIRSHLR